MSLLVALILFRIVNDVRFKSNLLSLKQTFHNTTGGSRLVKKKKRWFFFLLSSGFFFHKHLSSFYFSTGPSCSLVFAPPTPDPQSVLRILGRGAALLCSRSDLKNINSGPDLCEILNLLRRKMSTMVLTRRADVCVSANIA